MKTAILSYKVAQSFNIGMDISEETTQRYIQAVSQALESGHALFEETYEYPLQAHNIVTEHDPDSEHFFTYIDFKINTADGISADNPEALDRIRTQLLKALADGSFELIILWRRNFEAHIVFEHIGDATLNI